MARFNFWQLRHRQRGSADDTWAIYMCYPGTTESPNINTVLWLISFGYTYELTFLYRFFFCQSIYPSLRLTEFHIFFGKFHGKIRTSFQNNTFNSMKKRIEKVRLNIFYVAVEKNHRMLSNRRGFDLGLRQTDVQLHWRVLIQWNNQSADDTYIGLRKKKFDRAL